MVVHRASSATANAFRQPRSARAAELSLPCFAPVSQPAPRPPTLRMPPPKLAKRPNSGRLPDQLSGNHSLGRPPVFWLELELARAGCPAPSRERPRQRWLAGHVAFAHACHAAGALRPQATLAGRTCSPARRPCLRAHKLAGAECNLKPSSGAERSAEGAVTQLMFHCSLLAFAGAIAHHPPTQQLSGDCVLARSAVV